MCFITGANPAETQMEHTSDSVMTITDGLESVSIVASTESDSGKKEFPNTDSASPEELEDRHFMMTLSENWIPDSLDSFAVRIVECLGDGVYRVELTSQDSMTSLIGLFQVEAEQPDFSEEIRELDGLIK